MSLDEELTIDEEVRRELDSHLLAWEGVTTGRLLGGVAYLVQGRPFAVLMEGVIGMCLPGQLRSRALSLAGVSPFRPPAGGPEAQDALPLKGQWVQFVLLLPEDTAEVLPWLEAACQYVRYPG